eukprot:403357651
MAKLHEDSFALKEQGARSWFRNQAKGKPTDDIIKPKYLMNEDQVNQNEMMERLFKKFDGDGSGALDINELYELFQDNSVDIDRETLKAMFSNQKFTLRNFKNINNSPDALKKFRDYMRRIRDTIKVNSRRIYIPFSFEAMMMQFGQNLEREEQVKTIEQKTSELVKVILNKESSKIELEKIINFKIDRFAKMINANNVQEKDLSNQDNDLYQKLMTQSKKKLDLNNISLDENSWLSQLKQFKFTQNDTSGGQSSFESRPNETSNQNSFQHNFSQLRMLVQQRERDKMKQSIYDLKQDLQKHQVSEMKLDLMGMTKKRFIVSKDVDQFMHKISQDAKQKAHQNVKSEMQKYEDSSNQNSNFDFDPYQINDMQLKQATNKSPEPKLQSIFDHKKNDDTRYRLSKSKNQSTLKSPMILDFKLQNDNSKLPKIVIQDEKGNQLPNAKNSIKKSKINYSSQNYGMVDEPNNSKKKLMAQIESTSFQEAELHSTGKIINTGQQFNFKRILESSLNQSIDKIDI